MRLSSKGAIQLSLGFIVTVILSVTILVAGLLLVRQFVTGAQDIHLELSNNLKREISANLDSGSRVYISFSTQRLRAGATHIFGVGVLNIIDNTNFNLDIDLFKAYDTSMNTFDYEASSWLYYDDNYFNLQMNERKVVPVMVKVPDTAPRGTYIFKVNVFSENDLYFPSTIKIVVV